MFAVHMAIWEWEKMPVHSKRPVQVGALLFNKASIEVLAEYSNYSNIFSAENAAELPENTRMNEHAIELEEDKQPSFGPIYNLGPVELETLKTYIKTNLANGLIQLLNPPPEYLFFLIKSQIEASAFVWIIGVIIISPSKTNIHYLWLASR